MKKAGLRIDKQSELPVNSDTISQPVLSESQQPHKSTNASEKKVPRLSDEQYRGALRQFHSSQEEKPISTSINRLNDTAYRTAVRSMKNQTKKD